MKCKNGGYENPIRNFTDTIKSLIYGKELESQKPQIQKELLTREETADFFDVDKSTLWHWMKKGILIPVGIGGRVYYRKSDIEKSLIPLK